MGDLDFGDLSDDQLLGLLRSVLQEAVRRHPGVEEAARAAVLDEREKATIRVDAARREAAAGRARERERVAAEASARVRAEQAAVNAQAAAERERSIRESKEKEARARAEAAGRAAVEAEAKKAEAERALILRASSLVDRPPGNISVRVYTPNFGDKCVFLNTGDDPYARDHLAEYRGSSLEVRREFVGRRKELVAFCAELSAAWKNLHVKGSDHFPRINQESARG